MENGEYRSYQTEIMVGPDQLITLYVVQAKPGITTKELEDNPNITNTNTIYTLRSKGLVYSTSEKKINKWKMTKLGQLFLENEKDHKKFSSFGEWQSYRENKGNEDKKLPLPTMENGSCNHSPMPNGKCALCGEEVK